MEIQEIVSALLSMIFTSAVYVLAKTLFVEMRPTYRKYRYRAAGSLFYVFAVIAFLNWGMTVAGWVLSKMYGIAFTLVFVTSLVHILIISPLIKMVIEAIMFHMSMKSMADVGTNAFSTVTPKERKFYCTIKGTRVMVRSDSDVETVARVQMLKNAIQYQINELSKVYGIRIENQEDIVVLSDTHRALPISKKNCTLFVQPLKFDVSLDDDLTDRTAELRVEDFCKAIYRIPVDPLNFISITEYETKPKTTIDDSVDVPDEKE